MEAKSESQIVNRLAGVIDSWCEELGGAVGALSAMARSRIWPAARIVVTDDDLRYVKPGQVEPLHRVSSARNGRDIATCINMLLRELGARSSKQVTVVLPMSGCHVMEREIPLRAATRLAEVVDLEIVSTTPFTASNSDWTFRVLGVGRTAELMKVQYIIARKADVEAIQTATALHGLNCTRLDVWDLNPDLNCGVDLFSSRARMERKRFRQARLTTFISCLTLSLFLVSLAWLQISRINDASSALALSVRDTQSELATLRKGAQALLDESRWQEELVRLSASEVRLIEQLRRVTVVLPDTAWLTELTSQDGRLQLTGFALSTTGVIEALARSSAFTNVTLMAPITVDSQHKLERFVLSMKLANANAGGSTK